MRRVSIILVLVGCAKTPSGNPFDAAAPVTGPVAMEDDDESESSSEESSSSSAEESSSSAETSSSSTSASEDASSSGTFDPLTTGPADPTDGAGGQPATGEYSHCLEPTDCSGANLCVQIQQSMMVIDGFCSNYPCSNPAVDCDTAPGGTATPICFPLNVGGMDTAACALDCGAGQTCPTGMECRALGSGSLCT